MPVDGISSPILKMGWKKAFKKAGRVAKKATKVATKVAKIAAPIATGSVPGLSMIQNLFVQAKETVIGVTNKMGGGVA